MGDKKRNKSSEQLHIERALECLNGVKSLVLGGASRSVGEIICDLRITSVCIVCISQVGKYKADKFEVDYASWGKSNSNR